MTCFWFCYFLFACLYCGEMHVFTYAVPIDILDHLISCLLSLCLVTIVLACACCNGVVVLWISIRNVCACGFQIYGAYFVSTIWSIRVSLCHWVWLQARMVHAEKCTESGLIMSCMVSTFHCILYLCCASPLIHSALFSVLAHASAPNYVSDGWCSMLFNRHLRLWQWQWQACRLQTSVIFCREVDWQCARFVLCCVFIAGSWPDHDLTLNIGGVLPVCMDTSIIFLFIICNFGYRYVVCWAWSFTSVLRALLDIWCCRVACGLTGYPWVGHEFEIIDLETAPDPSILRRFCSDWIRMQVAPVVRRDMLARPTRICSSFVVVPAAGDGTA